MTTFYLGADRGKLDGNPGNITANTSSGTKDLELSIVMTNNPTKKDVLLFLEMLESYVAGDGVAGGQQGTYLPPL